MAKGSAGCWPRLDDMNTMEEQIRSAVLFVLQHVTGENLANHNTNQCYHKLIHLVHPDCFAISAVGFWVYYLSMTCSALISCCIAVVRGDEVMTAQKMPGMFITPFAADRNAGNHPPSDFEFSAAKTACTHLGGGDPFSEHWRVIVRVQNWK
jgi:hypothetical protein